MNLNSYKSLYSLNLFLKNSSNSPKSVYFNKSFSKINNIAIPDAINALLP